MEQEWEEGYEAGECGAGQLDNPYMKDTQEFDAWEDGRKVGRQVAESRLDSYTDDSFGIEHLICVLLLAACVAAVVGSIYHA